MVTSLENFVFASHLRKPKIRKKACDFSKPITSQTLLNDAVENELDMKGRAAGGRKVSNAVPRYRCRNEGRTG